MRYRLHTVICEGQMLILESFIVCDFVDYFVDCFECLVVPLVTTVLMYLSVNRLLIHPLNPLHYVCLIAGGVYFPCPLPNTPTQKATC